MPELTQLDQARSGPYKLGLLTPFKELPGEYHDVLAAVSPPVIGWQVVTQAEDSHDPDDLRAMGAVEPLADGLRRLERWGPDAVMWACTSGSFVLGKAGSIEQSQRLTDMSGVPARSTSLAFVGALKALGAAEVAVLSPYPDAATTAFVQYLGEWGIGVCDVVSLGHPGATSSEGVQASDIADRVTRLQGGDALLIPDTATWGFELWSELHQSVGKPLLTANQVTLWLGLGLLGLVPADPRFGALQSVKVVDPLQPDATA